MSEIIAKVYQTNYVFDNAHDHAHEHDHDELTQQELSGLDLSELDKKYGFDVIDYLTKWHLEQNKKLPVVATTLSIIYDYFKWILNNDLLNLDEFFANKYVDYIIITHFRVLFTYCYRKYYDMHKLFAKPLIISQMAIHWRYLCHHKLIEWPKLFSSEYTMGLIDADMEYLLKHYILHKYRIPFLTNKYAIPIIDKHWDLLLGTPDSAGIINKYNSAILSSNENIAVLYEKRSYEMLTNSYISWKTICSNKHAIPLIHKYWDFLIEKRYIYWNNLCANEAVVPLFAKYWNYLVAHDLIIWSTFNNNSAAQDFIRSKTPIEPQQIQWPRAFASSTECDSPLGG